MRASEDRRWDPDEVAPLPVTSCGLSIPVEIRTSTNVFCWNCRNMHNDFLCLSSPRRAKPRLGHPAVVLEGDFPFEFFGGEMWPFG